MRTVLVTGYEPFGGFDVNPSALVAQELDGARIAGAAVVGRVMPVELSAMPGVLGHLLEEHAPDVVLSLGLAAGSAAITLERVAINLADLAATPDNAGRADTDVTLVPGGPDALFATVPARHIVERLRAEGIPAQLSYSAGTHLCNAALYHALCLAHDRYPHLRAGFLHLPFLPEQAAARPDVAPSMSLVTMRRAVEIAVTVVAEKVNEHSRG